MKFTNLGGACGFIEHDGKRILFDPWLDEGIFHGAWHHYPPVNLPDGIEGIGRFDYIYISHIHEDHCSLGTLRLLNEDAELIIMDRKPNFVLQFVKRNNLSFKKIHLVPPWTKMKINDDFEVSMVTADPAHELNFLIDSGLMLRWDGFTIFNSNDCTPYKGSLDYIKSNYETVDLALLPYATGSSYPSCFTNLSHEEKLKEKIRLFEVGMKKFIESSNELNAKVVMPFADQYVIVGNRYELNQYMPHPASPGVIRNYYRGSDRQKLLLLNAGQSFDLSNSEVTPADAFYDYSQDDKDRYALAHSKALYDYEKIDFQTSVNLSSLMTAAAASFFKRTIGLGISSDTKFIVKVNDWKKKFILDNKTHTMTEVDFDAPEEEPFLKVTVPAGLLILMIIGQISWNIADAALFIDYTRVPNKYDPLIHSLWNYLKI